MLLMKGLHLMYFRYGTFRIYGTSEYSNEIRPNFKICHPLHCFYDDNIQANLLPTTFGTTYGQYHAWNLMHRHPRFCVHILGSRKQLMLNTKPRCSQQQMALLVNWQKLFAKAKWGHITGFNITHGMLSWKHEAAICDTSCENITLWVKIHRHSEKLLSFFRMHLILITKK